MALFSIGMAVRDYECDMQGIVNNAIYQHYFEHARHEFLKSQGLSFATITQAGVNMVVTRIEVDYLAPLVSGDNFVVYLDISRISRLRMAFHQSIVRDSDEKTMTRAMVLTSGVSTTGKIVMPPEIDALCPFTRG